MTIKYRKSIAAIGVAALSLLMTAPSNAATFKQAAGDTPGIIHVVSKVVNDNAGTKLPSDFTFNVKFAGADIAGSAFAGADGTGTTFTVAPGSYVVMVSYVDGYDGVWSGSAQINGQVIVGAGEEITITRTSTDVGVAVTAAGQTTETGGTLPKTSSPWFNLLAVGLLLSAAGAFGLRKSSVFH